MMRHAFSSSSFVTVPMNLRSRALAGVTFHRVQGQPLLRSTREDGGAKTSCRIISGTITQVAGGPASVAFPERGRGNLLLGGPLLARNLSSNAPSATPNGGADQEQQHILGQGNISNALGVSASAMDVVQDPLVASTEGNGIAMSDERAEAAAASVGAAASQPSHTVVEHPPAPGWEYPPVPDGCEPKFAIIRLGNTQYKVTKDDVIVAEKIAGDIGTTLEITDVLLVGTREDTVIGRPTVLGASVNLFIEEQTLDKKVIVFKKRRRKASKTTQGHRRHVTLLRVTDILH